MSLSYADLGKGSRPAILSILGRIGRGKGANGVATAEAVDVSVSTPPASVELVSYSDAEQQILDQSEALAGQPNWLRSTLSDGLEGGVQFLAGELHAWAVDCFSPLRPLPVAVIVDGSVVMEAFTDPSSTALLIPSGWYLCDHATLELVIDGQPVLGTGFTDPRYWADAAMRADVADYLDRLQRGWRNQRTRRIAQQNIDGTLRRLAQPDPVQEGQPVPYLRYLASSTNTPICGGGGALALANWIISDLMEDPLRRELFCLDPVTAGVLNEPIFNTRVLRGDISLALLCFWRRHYQTLDLFADEGLRRIQFKFATAPFIRIKNNDLLVTGAIRTQLSASAAGFSAGGLAWSWYWVCLLQDQGLGDRLSDAAYLRSISFREVTADALDPDRLSFNPQSWWAWWSGWACGDGDGFSRFDLALVSLLESTDQPAAMVAEQGAEHWRTRLQAAFYEPMPALSSLSMLCQPGPVTELPPVDDELPRCDLAIIGYTNGTGLARNMAMFVEALARCRPLVFDARSGKCVSAEPGDIASIRARVVLLCVNAGHVPEVIARFASLCADAHVIAFFLWETDRPPELHRFGALAVDEIWTPTQFVADAYVALADVRVSVVGKGLRPPPPARWQRLTRRFRRDGAFTFLCVADFTSSIMRKNPLAAALAFGAAFDADNYNVRLVIKLREIDRTHWSNIDGYWEELEALVTQDPRIEFLLGELADDEYWALLGSCDALVSLHRGEGFCYPVADAMMLGRPVVVTDYSGTRDFCTEATAFLVKSEVVPTPPAHLRCNTPIGHWAAPRQDSAVAAMRQVVAMRAEAATRGMAGKALIADLYDFSAWRAKLLARLAPYLEDHSADPARLMFTSLAPAWSAAPARVD